MPPIKTFEGRLHVECGIKEEPKIRNLQSAIRNENGFTLLEVLLAVSIMAFIVSAIYASFFTTGRHVEQAEAIRDSTDLARTLMIKMSDDIANAYVNSAMTGQTIFYGKKEEVGTGNDNSRHDSLSLTTLTNWRRMNSKETDLWEVGYFFKEKTDGTGSVLMRREKRELSNDIPALEGGVEYEITDQVEGLQFRYSNDGKTWLDEWDSRTKGGLPKMVEMGLMLESGMTYTTRVEVGKR